MYSSLSEISSVSTSLKDESVTPASVVSDRVDLCVTPSVYVLSSSVISSPGFSHDEYPLNMDCQIRVATSDTKVKSDQLLLFSCCVLN